MHTTRTKPTAKKSSMMSSKRRSARQSRTMTHAKRFSSAASAKQPIVVILSPPGGGKGTISKRLIKDYGCHHISTGDMLRAAIAEKTHIGQQAESYIERGELVPSQLIFDLLSDSISSKKDRPIVLDGFPRNLEQAQQLQKLVSVTHVFNLDVPDAEIVERLSGRWTHLPSGRVYQAGFNPPKKEGYDDHTGEELIRRPDDHPTAIKNRLDLYHSATKPLVGFYDELNLLTVFQGSKHEDLVSSGRRSDAIYKELVASHHDDLSFAI